MTISTILTDAATRRDQIRAKALEGLKAVFPLQARGHTLELHDLEVDKKEFGPQDQKDAIMEGRSLHEPVKGTVIMKDAEGKTVETAKGLVLMHLPYLTERHSFIVGGNEYQVANQLRMKPGVYTRRRANEELEASFNLSKGSNFRISLDPVKGHPYMEYGTTAIPLYPVLRQLGASHEDIAKHWGAGVADANKGAFDAKQESTIEKLYGKLLHPSKQVAASHAERVAALKTVYEATSMDPDVTEATLGHRYDKVTTPALLSASKKLLQVYKNAEDTDDRDSLAFKTFHSVAHFIKERIGLDARTVAMKVKTRAANKTTIREILPNAPFSSGVRAFLTTSQLSAIPTQINPMELIDSSVKITSLGEGGISSERAIPVEARQLHTTHMGILDPARTSESFKAGVDIRTSLAAAHDEHGNLYTLVRVVKGPNNHTFKYVSAKDIEKTVVAFPEQEIKGIVDAIKGGKVSHVPASEVEYQMVSMSHLYSPTTNMIPMLETIQGNRATMGSKHQTQALPLVHREVPWVQSGTKIHNADGTKTVKSFENILGKLTVPTAPVSGKIVKIDSQWIYIDPSSKKHAEEYAEKTAGEVKRQKTVRGVVLKIELEPGEMRRGVNKDTGKAWAKEMFASYGHVPKTRGDDGETVDIYVKDLEDCDTGTVYVVHQNKKDGTHDEDKCMLGWASEADAKAAYNKHVPDWCFGSITEMAWEDWRDEYLEERKKEAAKKEDGLIKVPYETNFPFASKTYLHQTLNKKVGDHVKEGEHMGDSNFTRDGELALGRNMRVGYMAYYGLNSNDAYVISEGAAQKLSSEHMYKESTDVGPDTTIGREIHRTFYGAHYTRVQYDKLAEDGVIKKGQKVMPHDPIIVGVKKVKQTAADVLLGNLRKSLVSPYREEIHTWEHDFQGEVIDVFRSDKRVVVTIKTVEPMRIGDKIAGRVGNKGVISAIIPDHQMIQDEQKRPLDVLFTSAGIISRINPAQVMETAIAKVAEKTGKPIIIENFSGVDQAKVSEALLKKHGIKDKETVFDPKSGKYIDNVLVGPHYILRLFKTTDTNFAARGSGAYDINQQPTKGGTEGAKGLGKMEFNALVAHNARNVLREASSIKSQKNDEFWRAVQLGLPLPQLKAPFAYDKFLNMIQAAGIHLDKQGTVTTLHPLTDKRTLEMSSGAVKNDKLVRAKDLAPERGGFFDPALTGGPQGTRWSHVDLAEPLVNPIFAEPARRLLGLTGAAFDKMQKEEGGAAIKKKLAAIDVDKKTAELMAVTKKFNGAKLDDVIKQIKYLSALKRAGLTPEAYVISKLPVIPPQMRPIVQGANAQDLIVGDSNYLYQNMFKHNQQLEHQVAHKTLPPAEHAELRQNLVNAVGAVIGTNDTDNQKLEKRSVKGFLVHLTGKTTPKSSFFQKKIEKKTQDVSGRGTAVPDGSLGIDEIGLPEAMLWGMFNKFVVARLIKRGFPAIQAKEMVEKKHPAARDALMAETKERPVIMNRAPTLWRMNMIGAYAVPVPGKTIRVNAFVEPHMNLDYDGDTLQIHAPVLPAAVEDVKRMTLSNLLFSDKQRDDVLVKPAMEAVLGLHLASKPGKAGGKVHTFKTHADAVAAYKKGEITLQDYVEVKP